MNGHLSGQALDTVGPDDQVSRDNLTRCEYDTWPTSARVNLSDGGTEPELDVGSIGDEIEEEMVEIGAVDL